MNSQGRHYRDPSNPNHPSCNYVTQGGDSCNFYETSNFAQIPYPEDITFGPVTDPPTFQNSDLSCILAMLNQQKAETDQYRKDQTEQFKMLQQQVNDLIQNNPTAVTSTVSLSTSPTVTSTYAPMNATISLSSCSAPRMVADAASSLNARLQASVASVGSGYTGLTMENLRSNPVLVSQAATVLANATHNVPPLNPIQGMAETLGQGITRGLHHSQVSNVDQLYRATTVNKQLRCYEFAQTGQFSYRSQLKLENCNAVAFAFGAFKHLEACKSGLITDVSILEFLARLRHLKNVFEIACLSSSLSSFSDPAWLVAREYDNRVISDIESGVKSWESLSSGIEPDSIYCAKETVENRTKASKKTQLNKDFKDRKPKKVCTTYNTHRSSEGCLWEQQNRGEKCVFDHFCSWCKENRNVSEKHKVFNCEHKTE